MEIAPLKVQLPRTQAYICDLGAAERSGYPHGQRDAGSRRSRLYPPDVYPRHKPYADSGCGNRGSVHEPEPVNNQAINAEQRVHVPRNENDREAVL